MNSWFRRCATSSRLTPSTAARGPSAYPSSTWDGTLTSASSSTSPIPQVHVAHRPYFCCHTILFRAFEAHFYEYSHVISLTFFVLSRVLINSIRRHRINIELSLTESYWLSCFHIAFVFSSQETTAVGKRPASGTTQAQPCLS